MKRSKALILSLLILFFIVGNVHLLNNIKNEKTFYTARVIEVKDGDTIVIDSKTIIRLANINAPEKSSPLYKESKDYLENFNGFEIRVEPLGIDRYGREIARLYSLTDEYLNFNLVEKGLASKYMVQDLELKKFSKAERDAISPQRGYGSVQNIMAV